MGDQIIENAGKYPSKKEKVAPIVLNCIRVFGAGMMVFGAAVASNSGGLASALIGTDGFFEYVLGGTFFVIGLFEFLLMPKLVIKIKNMDK